MRGTRPRARTALLFGFALIAAVSSSGQTVARIDTIVLQAGEVLEVRTGPVESVLSLDPDIARAAIRGVDTVAIEGLRPGVATVRVQLAGEVLILRAQVEPASTRRAGPGTKHEPPAFEHRIAYASHSGAGFDDIAVPFQTLLGRFHRGDLRGQGELWLESRDHDWSVPHWRLALTRPIGSWTGGLDLGTSEIGWSRMTFGRRRIAGALTQLRSKGGNDHSRVGLDVFVGEGRSSFLDLGSRFGAPDPRSERLGGARGWFKLSPQWNVLAEGGFQRTSDGDSRFAGALGVDSRGPGVRFNFTSGTDGERIAAEGTLDVGNRNHRFTLRAEHRDQGYEVLQSLAAPLNGTTWVSAGLHTRPAERWNLAFSGAWRTLREIGSDDGTPCVVEIDVQACTAATDLWNGRFAATWSASERLRIRAWTDYRDEGFRTNTRTNRSAGIETSVRPFRSRNGLAVTAGSELNDISPAGDDQPAYTWHSIHLGANGQLWDQLRLGARVEHRQPLSSGASDLRPLLGEASAAWRLPKVPALARGEIRASFRTWETIGFGDRGTNFGEYVSAGLHLNGDIGAFAGWSMEGSWNRDMETELEYARLIASVHYRLGGTTRAGEPRRFRPRPLTGFVYLDANENGVRDASEGGVGGVALRLADGAETRTDDQGRFRFDRVATAEAFVRVIPPAEFTARSGMVPVSLQASRRPTAEIALTKAPAILEVLAFNDLDRDGVFGEGEPLVRGVRLRISNEVVATDDAAAVRHPVTLRTPAPEWDWSSVPTGYQPGRWQAPGLPSRPVETVHWHLPLEAVRSVRGHVFIDDNLNGRRDPGEKGAAGIVVVAGSRRAVTEADGRFTLRGLPAGGMIVTIDPGTAGVEAPTGVEITLSPEPETVEGLTLPVRRSPRD